MNDYKTFVIAEIGCNHKGDMETAKELIKIAKIFFVMLMLLSLQKEII
jgi:N-acetylneuraminate synthase